MTNYEKALEQKSITFKVKRNIYLALGLTPDGASKDTSNDKSDISLHYENKHSDSWNDAICFLRAQHGYYGNSCGYSDMDKETATYIVKAINSFMPQIAQKAIEYADKDLKKASEEAMSEAKSILSELKATENQ